MQHDWHSLWWSETTSIDQGFLERCRLYGCFYPEWVCLDRLLRHCSGLISDCQFHSQYWPKYFSASLSREWPRWGYYYYSFWASKRDHHRRQWRCLSAFSFRPRMVCDSHPLHSICCSRPLRCTASRCLERWFEACNRQKTHIGFEILLMVFLKHDLR